MRLITALVFINATVVFNISASVNQISLVNNGYENIVIAIHEDIPENQTLIDKIKESFTNASAFLYTATKQRVYFKHFQILIPSTWKDDAEYSTSSNTFQSANIRIKKSNFKGGSSPFVKTYKGCGKPGEYMQITDNFMLDPSVAEHYGSVDKTLVHEWAHLRWGVFDEYGKTDDDEFYYSKITEKYEATRCTRGIMGKIYRYVSTDSGIKRFECTSLDKATGKYKVDCKFFSNIKQTVSASLMDRQYMESTNFFCDDSDFASHQHNWEAPSKHNQMCGKQSTWSVIQSTPDFQKGQNSPRTISDRDLIPVFDIVRRRWDSRVVLVLDESGSMNTNGRMFQLMQSVSKFIRLDIVTGLTVGIVMFSGTSRVLQPMIKVTSDDIREQIVARLPLKGDSYTSIGSGLRTAVKMLKDNKRNAEGGTIILLTDGEENRPPYIADVKEELSQNRFTIHTFAFTKSADNKLEALADNTGGISGFDSNEKLKHGDVVVILKGIRSFLFMVSNIVANEMPGLSKKSEVFSHSAEIPPRDIIHLKAIISDGLGSRTAFELSYQSSLPEFVVLSPSQVAYNHSYAGFKHDAKLKTVEVNIINNAETGLWNFIVNNKENKKQNISLSVTSNPIEKSEPVILNGYPTKPSNTYPPKWVIVADAMKGDEPIIGLNVIASVERPDGQVVDLTLLDNGKGADVQENDGIYSRYFTQFAAVKGRYSVRLKASANPGEAETWSFQPSRSARYINPENLQEVSDYLLARKQNKSTGSFKSGVSLVSSGGVVNFDPPPEVMEKLKKNIDIFPPGDINDLKVVATSLDEPSATLTWTATGNDLDTGRAFKYNIFISKDVNQTKLNFTSPISQQFVREGNLSEPQPSGDLERFEVYVDYVKTQRVSYLFAVQAVDESGNVGLVSNVISAGFGTVPPIVETEEVEDPFPAVTFSIKSTGSKSCFLINFFVPYMLFYIVLLF